MKRLEDLILTKIIATIGPACDEPGLLARLIEEGARIIRINFSHGSFDDFQRSYDAIRQASKLADIPVAILGDLCGPKIRIGKVHEAKPFALAVGDYVELTRKEMLCRRYDDTGMSVLSTNYPAVIDDVQPGHRVMINDGAIHMLVVDRVFADDDQDHRLVCRVTQGGLVSDRKGINLPDTDISAPSLTEYDKQCATWATEREFDALALSFVRRAEDVKQLRGFLKRITPPGVLRPPIVAKIEKPQALSDLDEICAQSEAVMVARGDLGVEMDLAEVPMIQKRVIKVAHDHGRPVFVATQMFQSMIEDPSPTRAEVSDVANAVFEGADGLMLSGETAVGAYPKFAVATMARIARKTEAQLALARDDQARLPKKLRLSRYRTAALARGVSVVAGDLHARFIVMWSERGGGARYLSQSRMDIPIIAATSSEQGLRQMNLLFGVVPVLMPRPENAQAFIDQTDRMLLDSGAAQPGEPVVVVLGEPIGSPGVTNEIRLHYVGDVCKLPDGPVEA